MLEIESVELYSGEEDGRRYKFLHQNGWFYIMQWRILNSTEDRQVHADEDLL